MGVWGKIWYWVDYYICRYTQNGGEERLFEGIKFLSISVSGLDMLSSKNR